MGDDFLAIYKTRAVVLKTQDLNESDKLVSLFSEKLGRISVVAKGAKKSKSKFLSLTLPFCYSDYVVFRGKNLYSLTEGELIDSFQVFLNDLNSLTYASYLCELIDISLTEEESSRELFKEFVTTFYFMKANIVSLDLLMRNFEVKLMKLTGYCFNLESCAICKKKISTSNYISFQYYGGVCENCEKINGIYISPGAYNSLKFLLKVSTDKIYRLILSKDILQELYQVLSVFIYQNYSRRPKSLELLNTLNNNLI